MAPTVEVDILPKSASISFLPSLDIHCKVFFRSLRSSNGKSLSSAYLKATAITPDCVLLSSRIFDNNTGPNSVIVARSFTPFSPERERNSTGLSPGVKGRPIFAWRSSIFG